MAKRVISIILFLLSFLGLAFSQDTATNCFTDAEVNQMYQNQRELEISDSLKTVWISLQQEKINELNRIILLDSTELKYKNRHIELLDMEVNLYMEYANKIKPKWYESRQFGFITGTLITLGTVYAVSHIP